MKGKKAFCMGLVFLGATILSGTTLAKDKNIRDEVYELLRVTSKEEYSTTISNYQDIKNISNYRVRIMISCVDDLFLELKSGEDGESGLRLIDQNDKDVLSDVEHQKLDYGFIWNSAPEGGTNGYELPEDELPGWEKFFDQVLYKIKPELEKKVEKELEARKESVDKLRGAFK